MTHKSDPLTLKLSLREKCAYGMGDFGSNLMLCIGTLYLLKFYTDELGMPAFYGGIIFLVAKFFTAFTDTDSHVINRKTGPLLWPTAGLISDRPA